MKLSMTGDGYIKCCADKDEHIVAERITKINASNLSLPCMKDRYDENVLFYHMGDNISVAEYLRSSVLDFEKLKSLALNLADIFIELEKSGIPGNKISSDINYVFISPHTQMLKVIACPIAEYEEEGSYQNIMSSICMGANSKGAYMVIGNIIEGIHNTDFNLHNFRNILGKVENARNAINAGYQAERTTVQKQVVEKRVVRNTTSYILCGILAVLMECAAALLFPYILSVLGLEEGRYLYSLFFSALFTIIIFLICKFATSKEEIESVRNFEPESQPVVRQMTQKTIINDTPVKQEVKVPGQEKEEQQQSDKTGILEEEVEINPAKRQEKYNRNSVPTAYLIEEASKKKYEIRKNYFMVGRSERCDLTVKSNVVSKEHAQIIYQSGDFYLKDLKSSNHTYLNKAEIEPEEMYKIEDGARIGFGNEWYIFKTGL